MKCKFIFLSRWPDFHLPFKYWLALMIPGLSVDMLWKHGPVMGWSIHAKHSATPVEHYGYVAKQLVKQNKTTEWPSADPLTLDLAWNLHFGSGHGYYDPYRVGEMGFLLSLCAITLHLLSGFLFIVNDLVGHIEKRHWIILVQWVCLVAVEEGSLVVNIKRQQQSIDTINLISDK